MRELKEYGRRFVAPDADMEDPAAVSEAFDRVTAMPRGTVDELERFVDAWMDVRDAIHERETVRYTAMTRDTADSAAEAGYLKLVETVHPVLERGEFACGRLFAESPALTRLDPRWQVFARRVANDVALFRERNVPLLVEEAKLAQEHQKLVGGWLVDWDGGRRTVQQVRAMLREPSRPLRERAWLAATGPHLADRERLDDLFDRMLDLRQRIAANAGCPDFRDYAFRRHARFDYGPADCLAFHRAIADRVVPLVDRMMDRRRSQLGIDRIAPWDLECDPEGLPATRPFATGAELEERTHRILTRIDPSAGELFGAMRERSLLDLESRPGKAPGGYMSDFAERRLPFIFMNAVGTERDVDTLLHESGHALNLLLARENEPSAYLSPPLEFAEVASMAMELLARPHLDEFYPSGQLERVRRRQLEEIVRFLPFMAMIDLFQHEVYTRLPDRTGRASLWDRLEARFRPHLEWAGLEERRSLGWQYLHVFQFPFYYVEYGIAQLGALQVWRRSLSDPAGAVAGYRRALSLGGSKSLPELFAAAGAVFDMTPATLGPLMDAVADELDLNE